MTAAIRRRPRAQETLISIGWQTGVDGRKYLSGTAVYDEAGHVCAASQQVWVVLKTSRWVEPDKQNDLAAWTSRLT